MNSHNQTNNEDTEDVEKEDSVEGLLRRIRNDLSWICSFCPGKCNDLDITVGESGTDE